MVYVTQYCNSWPTSVLSIVFLNSLFLFLVHAAREVFQELRETFQKLVLTDIRSIMGESKLFALSILSIKRNVFY